MASRQGGFIWESRLAIWEGIYLSIYYVLLLPEGYNLPEDPTVLGCQLGLEVVLLWLPSAIMVSGVIFQGV